MLSLLLYPDNSPTCKKLLPSSLLSIINFTGTSSCEVLQERFAFELTNFPLNESRSASSTMLQSKTCNVIVTPSEILQLGLTRFAAVVATTTRYKSPLSARLVAEGGTV